MAASSFPEQTPAVCQLCEESSQIKWKCIHCDYLLCTKCKNIHQKVTDAHDIVDIKEIHGYQRQPSIGIDFEHIKCKNHIEKVCCLYCLDCEYLVCPSCVTKIHKKHNMTDISEGYKLSLQTIKAITCKLEDELMKLGTGLSTVENMRLSEESNYKITRQEILQQDQILKEMVNNYTTHLIEKVDQQWITFHQSISDEESRVKQVTMEIESQIQKITEATNSNNATEVFEAVNASQKRSSTSQDMEALNTTYQKIPDFEPVKVTPQMISSIFGILQNIDFELEEKYTTSLPLIENMTCATNGSVWISHCSSKCLQNVNLLQKLVHINEQINYPVFNSTLTRAGELLVSTLQPALYILDRKSRFKPSRYNVSPLQTIGVHATKNNNILVGARETGPAFPVNGPRQVIKMNEKGKQVEVYEFDDNGRRLFTLPRRIVTDSNDNIYVSDAISEDLCGRIVILQKSGGVNTYEGSPEINKGHPFVPKNLTLTQLDNVIAADDPNHALHIINNEGHCIKYINVKLLGIKRPTSLDIDTKGKLHIGCNRHKSDPKEAKIYVVKFSGC